MEITIEMARRVLDVVDAGLIFGVGEPQPGQMCVEAAVCFALGMPHGDEPICVSRALRSLKIRLNDSGWSSPQARAQGLRRLALAQLGSAGALDEDAFIRRVVDYAIRYTVPSALRAAAIQKNTKYRQQLLDAANKCERDGTKEAAANAADAIFAARAAYAAGYAAEAAYAADAANAAYAAAFAANAAYAVNAAYAAAFAANAAYAVNAARDKSLADYAEAIVQILINMGAPGCQWLELAPLQEVT